MTIKERIERLETSNKRYRLAKYVEAESKNATLFLMSILMVFAATGFVYADTPCEFAERTIPSVIHY